MPPSPPPSDAIARPAGSTTSTELPRALYTAAEVRELDRSAIASGIPGAHLMQRAGRAAFAHLLRRWPAVAQLHVVCGTGNNGGDGYVIATLARARGISVIVWQVGDASRIRGDALAARQVALRDGTTVRTFDSAEFLLAARAPGDGSAVVVDALLGTGLAGAVREPFAAAIEAVNAAGLPRLAVDIPSGLCSDTGAVLGRAVSAEATVSFIGLKRGLLTGAGPAHCGALDFDDLAVPDEVFAAVRPSAWRLALARESKALSRRQRDAHKGHFGHVLIVGGDSGMVGAALMAAEAAARVGAGLVSCATRSEHAAMVPLRRPEVMARGVRSGADLAPMLARATVVAIGPGLGRSGWAQQLLAFAIDSGKPLVLDADALNLLADDAVRTQGGATERGVAQRAPLGDAHARSWVLTPHPGEAGRLLGCDGATVQRDRFAAVTAVQQRLGGVVVLKGAGTLVAEVGDVAVSHYGNPGMASGGMGDMLTGVIAGLLAQGLRPGAAARLGVCLHGRAADLAAAEAGERGLLATDLLPHLRRLVNAHD